MSDIHFYDPAKGHGLPHDPFKSIVAPRPIGWISTVDRDGRPNLAPYSFFNGFTASPPTVGFSNEKESDSLLNVRETGEFAVNIVGLAMAEQMSASSYPWPRGVDEMEKAGLGHRPGRAIRCPHVDGVPAVLECKVLQIIHLHDLEGRPGPAHLVLGQVVGVHIDKRFLHDGVFDTAGARLLARCGGLADYAVVTELLQMPRPRTEEQATLTAK